LSRKRPIVLAVTSDIHAGSTLAPCPPEGVRLDDGGQYIPSKVQLWQWDCWEDYWAKVAAQVKRLKADLWVAFNGDAVEGDHHGTSQIISRNLEAQTYVAERVFSVPLGLEPVRTFVVRGTEAHVGPSGNREEALARTIKAEKDKEAKTWSWWRLRLKAHNTLLDFQHHGRTGGRPWTRGSAVGILAVEIFYEHTSNGYRHPDLAIRSHRHRWDDSYKVCPTRLIQTAAWQLKTGHAHKVVPESIADLGGHVIIVEPDAQPNAAEVMDYFYKPSLPGVV
jgi:hypothetical protein